MVAYFSTIRIDRHKERAKFVDACVLYLEPDDLRDKYIELVKLFNKSMDIVLPDPFAVAYEYDLKLFNDIKLEAVNTHTPEKLFITKEESKKIQMIIDEHLRATGVHYLLSEAVDITDSKRFEEELARKGGKTKELTIANRIKHTIQANKKENPEFYDDLAKRLERLIRDREEDRIDQAHLLTEFHKIQEEIINAKDEWQRLGLASTEQFPIYKKIEKLFPDSKVLTIAIFDKIGIYLQKSDWKDHDDIKKTIRVEIKSLLRSAGANSDLLKSLPVDIVDILENQ
jgi:type I restriction enzyme R subunit